MTDQIRWGILGAAKFAREQMAPALHVAPGGTLAALGTGTPENSGPFRELAPGLRVHEGYDAVLRDAQVDAVYIPLPNHLHMDWTLKALEAGKHVLTEKPAAMNAAEIDAMIAARDASGKLAAEAFMIVHHPQWIRVRELLAEGEIGVLERVDAAFSFDNGEDTQNIRNRADTAGGALRDIGVYVMGGVRFATGAEPETVEAELRWENGVDVSADLRARFPGFDYRGFVSMRVFRRQEVTFHGRSGMIRLTAPFNAQVFGEARIECHRTGRGMLVETFPAARQYELQVAAFNRSALTGAPYACPLEFTRGTQAMMDVAFAAAGPDPAKG